MPKGTMRKFEIIGNLVADPESSVTAGGSVICRVRVATTDIVNNQEKPDYTRLTFFGKLAEVVQQHLKKGNKIYAAGKWRNESWEKDGTKHYSVEFYVNEMEMLGGTNGATKAQAQPAQPAVPEPDLPF